MQGVPHKVFAFCSVSVWSSKINRQGRSRSQLVATSAGLLSTAVYNYPPGKGTMLCSTVLANVYREKLHAEALISRHSVRPHGWHGGKLIKKQLVKMTWGDRINRCTDILYLCSLTFIKHQQLNTVGSTSASIFTGNWLDFSLCVVIYILLFQLMTDAKDGVYHYFQTQFRQFYFMPFI